MKLTEIALFGLTTANKTWKSKEWEVQDAFFEDQEIILQNPKTRSTKQWHECGDKPKKAWNGQDVACNGAYCASVCPIGYRSQGHWKVKCQEDNTWSKDSFSPCITCPDMSDEIADVEGSEGVQAQEIFVKNLPVAQFFCGDSSDTLIMKNKSYKGRGSRAKKKDVKCFCRKGQNGDPAWKKSCNWEFRGNVWYPHDVNTITCKDKNAQPITAQPITQPITAWTSDPGFHCWEPCDEKGGACDACNSGNNQGYCCRGDGIGGNGNCPAAAINAIPDDTQVTHICVVQGIYFL